VKRWGLVVVAVLVSILVGCPTTKPTIANPPEPSTGASAGAGSSASAGAGAGAGAEASTDAGAPVVAEKKLDVHVVPLGDVSADAVADAADALRTHAPLDVVIEARQPLPDSAKTAEKNRYSADRLLDFLAGLPISSSTGHGKVVGVTDLDIVTPKNGVKNWGILGLGAIDGRSCVFSTYRMKRAFEKGGGASDEVVHERLWKVALHELGHTLGLEHCPVKGCIMEDAEGTVKTVDGESALCPACAKKMAESIEKSVL
jgi:archaemetzincin